MIWVPMLSCIVFLFFNLRKRAKCFAGDVGSITMAFWVMFLLLKLILDSENWAYMLFLSVYGVDSVLTIIHRILLRQNIFDAHRLHFYQIMANEQKMPHVLVSFIYALVQLLIVVLVLYAELSFLVLFFAATLPLVILYVLMKPRLMGRG